MGLPIPAELTGQQLLVTLSGGVKVTVERRVRGGGQG